MTNFLKKKKKSNSNYSIAIVHDATKKKYVEEGGATSRIVRQRDFIRAALGFNWGTSCTCQDDFHPPKQCLVRRAQRIRGESAGKYVARLYSTTLRRGT